MIIKRDSQFFVPSSIVSAVNADLEEYGADIAISPNDDFPAISKKMLIKHLEKGAVLCKIMTMQEFCDTERAVLAETMLRMHKDPIRTNAQRCLILLGEILSDGDKLAINGKTTKRGYADFVARMSSWDDLGAVHTVIPNPAFLSNYLIIREQTLKVYTANVDKLWNMKEHSLAIVEEIGDWRTTISTLPRIGVARASAIKNNIPSGELIDAIVQLTDWKIRPSLSNDQLETNTLIRKWFGLPDGFNITVEYVGE